MIALVEEKQVGPVSYMVKDIETLNIILQDERILRSRKEEYNPKNKKKQYYVSLSRNMTAAAIRNESRWRYGVILDGTKLSNKYVIEPVSYIGTVTIKSSVMLKTLTAYENDTYAVTFVKFPSMSISIKSYEKLKSLILSMSEEMKTLKKLEYQSGGKRAVKGTKIKEKFNFNVPTGGIRITTKEFPELISILQKDPALNEYEERIWLKGSEYFVNIKHCITGVILPKSEKESTDVDMLEVLNYAKDSKLDILWY